MHFFRTFLFFQINPPKPHNNYLLFIILKYFIMTFRLIIINKTNNENNKIRAIICSYRSNTMKEQNNTNSEIPIIE